MSNELVVLPKLLVKVTGKVTESNLVEFQESANKFMEGVNRELTEDEHFGQAELDIKSFKAGEDIVKTECKNIIAQTQDVDQVLKKLQFIGENFRTGRLELEKLVKARKDAIKVELLNQASTQVTELVTKREEEICADFPLRIRYDRPDFYQVIKGLRTIDSIKENLTREVAASLATINECYIDVTTKIKWFKEQGYMDYKFLFGDMEKIIHNELEGFKAMATLRINDHKAAEKEKEEKQREKIRLEEEAKARQKVEAETKAEAEAEAKAKAEEEAKDKPKIIGVDLASQESKVTEVIPNVKEDPTGGDTNKPTDKPLETIKVTTQEDIIEARNDCNNFMAKYMNMHSTDPIRQAMLKFLTDTDWVE